MLHRRGTDVTQTVHFRTLQVTTDEYNEFYKTTFKAYDDPMAKVHFSLEGQARPCNVRVTSMSPRMSRWGV